MQLIPFLSLFSEQLPPHLHELHLQTPRSFSVSNVVSSGLKRTHAFSEETVKKKKQSVIKTSAYIFLGYTTKKKSRGRSISSLLSTQVAKKIRYQVWVWRSKFEESEHFVVKGLVKLWPRSLSAAWAGSFWDQPGIGEAPSASEEPNWLALTSSREPVINFKKIKLPSTRRSSWSCK